MSRNSRSYDRRGRDRSRRRNINAFHDSCNDLDDLLSPTNRASQLNRNSSQHFERAFEQRRRDPSNSVWNERFPRGKYVIYTDGSYVRWTNMAGIGIFMGPGHELNRSQRFDGYCDDNNLAEMVAIQTALVNLLDWDGYNRRPVIIRTDSKVAIQALRFENSMYPELVQQIYELSEQCHSVEFQHVYAHEGDPGNEMANKLAGLATGTSGSPGRRRRSASRGFFQKNWDFKVALPAGKNLAF